MRKNARHTCCAIQVVRLKVLLIAFLALGSLYPDLSAQKQANFWYFGKNAGLDFTNFDPMPLVNSQMDAPEGVASVADASGQLLFYTDGQSIWNSNHEQIRTGLSGDPTSTQSATIVPDPDTTDQYFIFTTRSWDPDSKTNFGGNFYKIRIKPGETGTLLYDYSAATGKGGLWTGLTEKFLAIPFVRADGKNGYWFIMHEFNSDNFVVIKYDGTLHTPSFPIVGNRHYNGENDDGTNRGAAGQMKVNDARNRIALAVEGARYFEVFRFDTLTGRIDRPMQIPAGDLNDKFAFSYGAYGVEFSPTGRYGYEPDSRNYLYGTTRDGGQVYQWDLTNYDNRDSLLLIKTGQVLYSNPEIECGALQLAPNGKIYTAFNGKDFLGVINAPMRPDCHFRESGARLTDNETGLGGLSALGLPAPLPIINKQEPFYFENLCIGDTTLFYITDQTSITPNTPKAWTFIKVGGGATPVTKTSQTMDYRYEFKVPGTYEVRLTVFKSGNPVQYSRYLTINSLPDVQLIKGNFEDRVSLCVGTELHFDAGYGAFYEWENDTINVRRRDISDNGNLISEYRVKVTDYHGCVGWDTIFAVREIPPTSRDSSFPAFCAREDGSAIVIPNGNTGNFNYAWEGYPDINSNILGDIPGGQYVVKVTSKRSGCSVMDTVKVEAIGLTDIKIEKSTANACPGEIVSLSVKGADAVEWLSHPELSGKDVQIAVDETTVIRIKTTNYRDERTCELEVTDTIKVLPHVKPDLPSLFNPCGGHPLVIDGGDAFEDWQWSDGQSGQFATIRQDIDNLVLTVTDANGCVFTDATRVTFLPGPTFTLPKDTAFCTRDPVTLTGGEGESYLWSRWDQGLATPLATTRELTVSESGSYILSITESGCTVTDTVRVHLNNPDLFRIDTVKYQDISCKGSNNGEIRITATGTAHTFFYSIDGGNTFFDNGGVFTGLAPGGPYVVVVNEDGDEGACRQIWPEVRLLEEPEELRAKFCTLPPSCPDCADGVITVGEITGGTPPYSIYLNGSPHDSIMKNLREGNYPITVTDANQCSFETVLALLTGMRPELTASTDQPVCPGQEVILRVTNAKQVEWINPPNQYSLELSVYPLSTTWYRVRTITTDTEGFTCETILEWLVEVKDYVPLNLMDTINQCEGLQVELDGGDYVTWEWSNGSASRYITLDQSVNPLILTVSDSNGCILTDTVAVLFHPYPVVDLGADQRVCSADPIELSGGQGDEYLWNTGQTTPVLPVAVNGTYSLTITTKGCSASDTVSVWLVNPETVTIQNVRGTDNRCFGSNDGELEILATSLVAELRYSIDGGLTYQSDNQFTELPVGVYNQIRISADSTCFFNYPDAVTICQPDSIQLTYRLKSPTCETCRDGQLTLTLSGGVPPYRISLNGSTIDLITRDLGVGSYVIIVTDANLCTKTAEFTLEMLNQIPNVITTNGDGINDLWSIPLLKYYPDAIVKVFSTAAQLVFESPVGYPVPWDGRYNGSPLPMGTYYYVINLGPGEETRTGYLTILR